MSGTHDQKVSSTGPPAAPQPVTANVSDATVRTVTTSLRSLVQAARPVLSADSPSRDRNASRTTRPAPDPRATHLVTTPIPVSTIPVRPDLTLSRALSYPP